MVNPKFLKPRVNGISDALIRKLGVGLENDKTWSLLLESLVEGGSIDELMVLEGSSLGKILACSVMRMNFSLFHRAVSCIEAGGRVYSVMFRLTNVEAFRDALMEADAVQMLMRMIRSHIFSMDWWRVLPSSEREDVFDTSKVSQTPTRFPECLRRMRTRGIWRE